MDHIQQRPHLMRRADERYGRQAQFENGTEDKSDEVRRVIGAILGASVAGLLLWATVIGTGYLIIS